jgi:transcriptional regulator with XRE-family HTH domain
MNREVGAMLRTIRERLGLTQQHVADRVGLERTSISNMESGRQGISLQNLSAICAAFDMEPHIIMRPKSGSTATLRKQGDIGGMGRQEYLALSRSNLPLPESRVAEGWHYSAEWDFLLIHPSWPEAVACGITGGCEVCRTHHQWTGKP